MKKVIALFITSFAPVTSLYAQVTFIPKVGASWASVSLNDEFYDQLTIDYGHKTGLIIGIAVGIPLVGDRLSLQTELLFHQKGYTLRYDDNNMVGSYKYTLNYFEMPVLASVHFGKFHIATGPYFGFGVDGKYQGPNTYLGQSTDQDGKIEFGEKPDNYGGTIIRQSFRLWYFIRSRCESQYHRYRSPVWTWLNRHFRRRF